MEEVLIHYKESVIITFHNVNWDHAHIMGGL